MPHIAPVDIKFPEKYPKLSDYGSDDKKYEEAVEGWRARKNIHNSKEGQKRAKENEKKEKKEKRQAEKEQKKEGNRIKEYGPEGESLLKKR